MYHIFLISFCRSRQNRLRNWLSRVYKILQVRSLFRPAQPCECRALAQASSANSKQQSGHKKAHLHEKCLHGLCLQHPSLAGCSSPCSMLWGILKASEGDAPGELQSTPHLPGPPFQSQASTSPLKSGCRGPRSAMEEEVPATRATSY